MLREFFEYAFPQQRLNKSLRILIASNTILMFVIGLFAPFYAIFVQRIGGSVAFAGFTWGIFSIVTGLLTLVFSRWGLRMKEQELMIALGYLIRGIVFLSYAFMGTVSQLVFTQILWGIGAAIGTPAFDAIYAKHTTTDDSLMQWGQWEGVSSIAAGIAALLGGILIETFGFQIVFFLMALTSFIIGGYIWSLPRELL